MNDLHADLVECLGMFDAANEAHDETGAFVLKRNADRRASKFLRTHRDELLGVVEGWRPIESAQKDGSSVLLGYAGSHSEEGRWVSDESRNHWGETGWFSWDTDVLCEHPSKPTHWRPLPAPPAIDAARHGRGE